MHKPISKTDPTIRMWRRTAFAFVSTFFGGLALYMVCMIVIDPHDSGRFPTFMPGGSPDTRPPTVGISRGRVPGYDAVVLGSSRSAVFDAATLRRGTRFNFMQMAAPGTGPRDQMALLHWFARHRPNVKALVIAYDDTWCVHESARLNLAGFPFGLYSDNTFAYLADLFSSATLIYAQERIEMVLGKRAAVDPAGFIDIEALPWSWVPDETGAYRGPTAPLGMETIFPALTLLDAELRNLPSSPIIVFWAPPLYHSRLPQPNTPEGNDMAACKSQIVSWTSRHPRSAFLDFAVEMPEIHDPKNFMDESHIRKVFMRKLEPQVAEVVMRLDRYREPDTSQLD